MTTRIDGYPIDVVLTSRYTRSTAYTRNPVERGEPTTDHVSSDPPELEFEGVVSDRPLAAIASDPTRKSLVGAVTPSSDAFRRLQDIQDSGRTVSVECAMGFFESMIVAKLQRTTDVRTTKALKFTVTFARINILENNRTTVTSTIPTGEPNLGLSADKLASGNKFLWRKGRPPGTAPFTEPPGVIVGQEIVQNIRGRVSHTSGPNAGRELSPEDRAAFFKDLDRDIFAQKAKSASEAQERERRKRAAERQQANKKRDESFRRKLEAFSRESPGQSPDKSVFGK